MDVMTSLLTVEHGKVKYHGILTMVQVLLQLVAHLSQVKSQLEQVLVTLVVQIH